MGPTNKLLHEVDGVPMVRRVVRTALDAGLDRVVVVTGHDADRVSRVLDDLGVRIVHNQRYAEGLSTSLAAGLAAVGPAASAAVICLGDMPWVRAEHVRALVGAFLPDAGASICVPVHEGKRGNPVLWSSRYFGEMSSLTGDHGARGLLDRHPGQLREVEVPDDGVLRDVDRPGDEEVSPSP